MMKSTPWRIGRNSPTNPKAISDQPTTSTTTLLICSSINANDTLSVSVSRPPDLDPVVNTESREELAEFA